MNDFCEKMLAHLKQMFNEEFATFVEKCGKNSVKWLYGNLMYNSSELRCLYFYEDSSDMRIDPDTVRQFIGISDCNSKQVYEGDINE